MSEQTNVADAICPRCQGPMPSPTSIFELRADGVPVSEYVCRACSRAWLRRVADPHRATSRAADAPVPARSAMAG